MKFTEIHPGGNLNANKTSLINSMTYDYYTVELNLYSKLAYSNYKYRLSFTVVNATKALDLNFSYKNL